MYNYIDEDYFIASPFYCTFPTCCSSGEVELRQEILGLIEVSQSIFDSYLGFSFCNKQCQDIFRGDDSDCFFTRSTPVIASGNVTASYRVLQRYRGSYFGNYTAPVTTGVISDCYVEDDSTGLIRFPQWLRADFTYTVNYEAGYHQESLPKDIKTAMCMMVLNLAQRLDNGQLSNPDHTVDSLRVDKASSVSFGNSKLIKQVVLKKMSDFNDLPIPVLQILNRYKFSMSL